jgi:hypothetical protein
METRGRGVTRMNETRMNEMSCVCVSVAPQRKRIRSGGAVVVVKVVIIIGRMEVIHESTGMEFSYFRYVS